MSAVLGVLEAICGTRFEIFGINSELAVFIKVFLKIHNYTVSYYQLSSEILNICSRTHCLCV